MVVQKKADISDELPQKSNMKNQKNSKIVYMALAFFELMRFLCSIRKICKIKKKFSMILQSKILEGSYFMLLKVL